IIIEEKGCLVNMVFRSQMDLFFSFLLIFVIMILALLSFFPVLQIQISSKINIGTQIHLVVILVCIAVFLLSTAFTLWTFLSIRYVFLDQFLLNSRRAF